MAGHLMLDLRFALRSLRHSWRLSIFAALLLAVGIGVTTALFSALDTVLLRDLPFPDATQLVEIYGREGARTGMRVPQPLVQTLQDRSQTIATLSVHGPMRGTLRTNAGMIAVTGDHVSANYFDLHGVRPIMGRGFLPAEERPGAPPVLVVAHRFWEQQLNADPQAIGRAITMNDTAYVVVGVMASSFRTTFRTRETQFWTPQADERLRKFEAEEGHELIARLKPGVTLNAARRELDAIAASYASDAWRTGHRRLGLHDLKQEIVRDRGAALPMLVVAALLVLVMMCVNLAQLQLARAETRQAEFAIRKAIGANSVQLFRLALLESLILSAGGGLAGILLAHWLLPVIVALAPTEIPRLADARVDGRVLLIAMGMSAVTGCAFGLLPALRLSRLVAAPVVKAPVVSATPTWVRLRSLLVALQVAASVALVGVTGLVGRAFLTLLPWDPGFRAEGRWSFALPYSSDFFTGAADRTQKTLALERQLRTVPGVRDIALASNIPFSGDEMTGKVTWESATYEADIRAVSPGFFDLLHMPVFRGRAFSSRDDHTAPGVAIVNNTFAHRLAPDGNVLGRRLRVARAAALPEYEIVGVVADARSTGTSTEIWNEVYIPATQSRAGVMYVVAQVSHDDGSLTRAIRSAVAAVLPEIPIGYDQVAKPLRDLVTEAVARPRFSATLMGALSATALVLAAIGILGLVSYTVSSRRREFGVRAALGARPRDLTWTAMRPVLAYCAIGLLAGVLAGIYAVPFFHSQIHDKAGFDGPLFVAAAVLILAMAALAAYIPGRLAGRADPSQLLRQG